MDQSVGWTVSVLAAVVPTVCYVLVLWWLDRYEKEPLRLLSAAFLWGAIPAVLASVVAEIALGAPLGAFGEAGAQLLGTSLLAPVVEELAKGAALLVLFLRPRSELDNVLDGVIYGGTIGFGFAMTENVLYFVSSLEQDSHTVLWVTILLRTIVFGLNHGMFTALFGAALGYARTARGGWVKWMAVPLGLLGAVAAHAIHNLFTSLSQMVCYSALISLVSDWAGVLIIGWVVVLAWRQEKRWITGHLRAEVEGGLISEDEYDVVGSYRRRVATQWKALAGEGLNEAKHTARLSHLATELAFRLERGDHANAEKLRQQIRSLRGTSAATLATLTATDLGPGEYQSPQ